MSNWNVNTSQTSPYSEVLSHKKTKEYLRAVNVFIIAVIGVVISLIGYLTKSWGHGMTYYFAFLTYQANIMVIFYYGAKVIAYRVNKDLYTKISRVGYHGAITSYIMLTFVVIMGSLVTYSLFSKDFDGGLQNFKDLGGVTGMFWRHGFVHFITPLVVFYDFLKTKHNKEDIEKMSFGTIVYWHTYIMAYLLFINILGIKTGMYVYPITNFDKWGSMILLFYPMLFSAYWLTVGFLFYSKKRAIVKDHYYTKNKKIDIY